ncbi:winged helix-turn-helix transcriptional regulator [Rhizobium sp. BK377]|uniref:winged helix-turn-helix transcriptional regulator n=1 Tax=Rhizobium sp. BK377 TaxID=2587058 RepID=UPI001615D0C4|nr:helix-turn-helix domain-containing protein [Rhizobium sp. BK377]MBB3461340.1 DNA-binding HxlR family transcriptional regulator [Rhizobium sp. BK377]
MKGKRTDMGNAQCGIAHSLQAVGDWWSLLIIREAFKGLRRFSEFQKSLGLAKNILSVRLRKLVEEGIFTVEPDPDSALSHLYLLTPKGFDLSVVLVALWQWGEEHCFEPGELNYAVVDSLNGQPLRKLQLAARDGRSLGPRQFRIEAVPVDG